MKVDLSVDSKNIKHLGRELTCIDKKFRTELKNTLDSGMDKLTQDLSKRVKKEALEVRRETEINSRELA